MSHLLMQPVAFEVYIRPVENEPEYRTFSYWEGFPADCAALQQKTIDALRPLMAGIGLHVDADNRNELLGIHVHGICLERLACNFMAGEFLTWSDVGQVTIRQLLERAALYEAGL
jgi:hypothetical protein